MKSNQVAPQNEGDGVGGSRNSVASKLVSFFCCCCSMNIFLPAILIFQTAIAVIAIWIMGIVSADAQITMLASKLSDSEAQRLEALTQNYFQQFPFLMKTFIYDDEIGAIAFDQASRYNLANNLFHRKATFPELDYIYFGFPDKGFIGIAAGLGNYNIWVSNFTVPAFFPWVYWTTSDPTNKYIDNSKWTAIYPFDPRYRPWYTLASAKPNTVVWTPIFMSALGLGFTVAYGFQKNNQIVAVAAIESTLNNLSVQLKKLELSENGRIFVIEKDTGLLVATSHGELSNVTTNARLYSNQSSDDYVRTASEFLYTKYNGGFSDIVHLLNETTSTYYYIGNEKMLLQIRRLYISETLDWITVILTPEYDIMGSIYTMYIIMAAVVVAIIILSSAVVISLTLCVTVPLMRLGTQMTEVANMTLKEVGSGVVFVREVVTIQKAFNRMVSKLKEYKAFLPDHILNRDFGEGDEAKKEATGESAYYASEMAGASQSSGLRRGSTSSSRSRARPSIASAHQASHAQQQIFALGVELKEVCLLQLKVLNRSDLFLKITPQDYVQVHGRILDEVIRILARQKGSLMFFDEETVAALWATNTRFVNGAKNACNAALEIRKFIDNLAVEESLPIQYAISVVKGGCLCGNIGTSNKRIYTAFGEVRQNGLKVIKYGGYLKAKILVDAAIHDAATSSFEFQQIPDLGFTLPSSSTLRMDDFHKRVTMYHLVTAKSQQKGDEWMYELQQSEAANQLTMYNTGYQLYSTGEFAKAIEVLEKILSTQSIQTAGEHQTGSIAGEIPTIMHRLCQQLLANNDDKNMHVVMSFADSHIEPCFIAKTSSEAKAEKNSSFSKHQHHQT